MEDPGIVRTGAESSPAKERQSWNGAANLGHKMKRKKPCENAEGSTG